MKFFTVIKSADISDKIIEDLIFPFNFISNIISHQVGFLSLNVIDLLGITFVKMFVNASVMSNTCWAAIVYEKGLSQSKITIDF